MILQVTINARVWVDESIPVPLLLLDNSMDIPMLIITTEPGQWSTRILPHVMTISHAIKEEDVEPIPTS